MLDPKEYAEQLVEKYIIPTRMPDGYGDVQDDKYSAQQCALIDVQNTIDALENLNYCTKTYILNRIEIDAIEYFNQVKEHIKQL